MTTFTEAQLSAALKGNPDLRVYETRIVKRAPIAATFEADSLSSRFETLWAQLGGPAYVKEYRFDPVRRWRFDYAWPEQRIALELHGGVWSQGRHVRGGGFLRDREKMNAAQLLGWQVAELGTGQVTAEFLAPWVERMKP